MRVNFRQGIVKYRQTGATQQFLLQTGTGVNLLAESDPTIVAVAHGDANYLITESYDVIDAWLGPFVGGTDYYLFWDLNIITGQMTRGHTTVAPIVSASAPTSPVIDQHWFDVPSAKMRVWNGLAWQEKARVFSAKLENGNIFVSMSLSGPVYDGTQVGLTTPSATGSLIYDSHGRAYRDTDRHFLTTEDPFLSGISAASRVRVESLSVPVFSMANMSEYTLVTLHTLRKVRPASFTDVDLGVPVGIVEPAVGAGQQADVVYGGTVVNQAWSWTAPNMPLYCDADGNLVETPALLDVNKTPVAWTLDEITIFLRPAQAQSGASTITITEKTNDISTHVIGVPDATTSVVYFIPVREFNISMNSLHRGATKTNPSSTVVFDVQVASGSIGSFSVDTSGVFDFSGLPATDTLVSIGQAVEVITPADVFGISDLSFTLYGMAT